jgi:hypothetical protein
MKRILLALALMSPVAVNAQYRITQHYPVGGEGSWDYVVPDTAHHRLFIGRQDRVMVVDENDGRLLEPERGTFVTNIPLGGKPEYGGVGGWSNADGTLTVIHQDTPDTYHVAQTIERIRP